MNFCSRKQQKWFNFWTFRVIMKNINLAHVCEFQKTVTEFNEKFSFFFSCDDYNTPCICWKCSTMSHDFLLSAANLIIRQLQYKQSYLNYLFIVQNLTILVSAQLSNVFKTRETWKELSLQFRFLFLLYTSDKFYK